MQKSYSKPLAAFGECALDERASRLLRFILIALLFLTVRAHAVPAVVVVDEAQVYATPDLDGKVLAVVPGGSRVTVSKGVRGGYAKFRRARVLGADGKAVVGWISSIEVKTENEVKAEARRQKKAAEKKGAVRTRAGSHRESHSNSSDTPFAFSRSVGLAIGVTDYKESIGGVDRTANLLTYGLKITGTDVLLTGPLMDINILFHYGAPEYYETLSTTKPSGFLMWTDFNLLLPFRMRDESMLGVGLGPLFVLSNMTATTGGQTYSMWALNLGVTLEAMASMRIGDVAVRLEGKYWFERKTYHQAQLAVQTLF